MLITVTKQPDTSTEKLTEKLDEIVVDLRKNLPADVHVSTDIFRQSHFIDNSINNVKEELVLRGSFLRGDRLVPVLDEYTYDGDLVGSLAVIFAGLYHRIALHGIDD